MKKIVPQNNIVLCTLFQGEEETRLDCGFVYKSNNLPLYRVESIGRNVKMKLRPNDLIVVNSTGTKAILDNVEYFLFSEENIMGKIED